MDNFNETSKKLNESLSFIKTRTSIKPKIGIVLGSGLGVFVNEVHSPTVIPFHEIPHFMPTTVEGHKGNLIFGSVASKETVVLQGRNHFYEGHSMDAVVFPTRLMALLGIQTLILTNSAGGLNETMSAGDLMIIEDHINLTGTNPLIGPNIKEFGPRFPDMTEAYDKSYIKIIEEIMHANKIPYQKGVYAGLTGPTYETPSEVKYLKIIGANAVGMSTVSECIAANHMGVRVTAISCISNLAAGISKTKLSHDEVTDTAKKVEKSFSLVLKKFIEKI